LYSPLISDVFAPELFSLYRDMVVVRRIDGEATALQRQGELALWVPLYGQEAAQVGSVRAVGADDFIFPSYRDHGVVYCRGADVGDLLPQWRGTGLAGWSPQRLGMAVPSIVVGAQCLHAVGFALGTRMDAADSATVVYFGDGAMSQGDVAESFTFAASWQAPVVFFCENNQWAISEPVEVQARHPLVRRADGYGFLGIRVDGNDVLAVLAATRQAVKLVRSGRGPVLLEAVTYRMGPHTTSDDPSRYRDRDEVEIWRRRDPIERLRLLLEREHGYGADAFSAVETEASEVGAQLRKACLTMPDPRPEELHSHVYKLRDEARS
jgi:pyruvate dehydrogenase E1 component alpha subunit